MKTWLRAKTRGLLALALIAALVAGGLGWVSTAALRLEEDGHAARVQAEHADRVRALQREREQRRQADERERQQVEAQAQAEFAGRLRLAMWRLDSRIARVLAREDARPYHHFNAMFAPSVALDARGQRVADGAVLEPSPLLSMDLPDWMLLHFQAAAETGWGSPQVLTVDYQKLLAKHRINFSNVTRQRIQLLSELSNLDTTQSLVQGIERQELQFALANNDGPANPVNPVNNAAEQKNEFQPQVQQQQGPQKDLPQPSKEQGGQLVPMYSLSYPSRLQQRNTINFEALKNNYAYNEDANVLTANTNNLRTWQIAGDQPPAPASQVQVSLSPMVPLWLETPDQERLVVARLVRIVNQTEEQLVLLAALPLAGGHAPLAALGVHDQLRQKARQPRLVCQGIVLDWPGLENLLTSEVRDLFPKAKVRPMRDEVPPHPERTMTALPVEFDPGEGVAPTPVPPADPVPNDVAPEVNADLGWTPLRIGLALAWAAALVALTAVGLGGWSLLDLSERRIRFVSAVTHELRSPLTTLRLYLDMLTGGLVKSEEQRAQYLQTLHAETERLNRLVGNVLDFSRLENQRPRLERTPIALGDLLGQLQTTWQARCGDAEKILEVDNTLGAERVLVTDVQLVQQIVGNLIDNACKYSRAADDHHVWVRARAGAAGRVRIEVEDRGPGVKAAECNAIFRPFCRGGDSDVVAGGVGLGLALARRWAGMLGGRLTLETPAGGVGACFVLELATG